MNEEEKIHINSFKFYDRDELEDLAKQYYLENQQLKEQLEKSEKVRKDAMDLIEKLRFEKWSITGTDIIEVMDILDIDKGE